MRIQSYSFTGISFVSVIFTAIHVHLFRWSRLHIGFCICKRYLAESVSIERNLTVLMETLLYTDCVNYCAIQCYSAVLIYLTWGLHSMNAVCNINNSNWIKLMAYSVTGVGVKSAWFGDDFNFNSVPLYLHQTLHMYCDYDGSHLNNAQANRKH